MNNKKKRLRSFRCGPLALLVFAGTAGAQSQPNSNEAIAQAFAQAGGATPQVVAQPDGSTRIEWHGNATVDVYGNKINSAGGTTTSPLTSGTFGRSVFQSDLRGIGPGGDVSQFQLGMTFSNDRSVLSQTSHQINNLQLGRAGPNYQISVGDVMPNFSTLSSALGVRGLMASRQFGNTGVSGYTGVVAESWEALGEQIYRNQLVREVYGVKVDHAITPGLKVFATGQEGSDRSDSITAPGVIGTLQPARVRAGSGGLTYQDGPWQLSTEAAMSGYEQTGLPGRHGHAFVADGSWRGTTVTLRSGFHDIDTNFVSLSTAAQAGIKEGYVGGDWTAASWLSLGSDLRRTKLATLDFAGIPSTITRTDSGSARATVNLGPNWPGWTGNLQQAESRIFDALGQRARNEQSSAGVNYASPTWTSGFNYGLSKVRSAGAALSDSDTESYQLMLGRSFSNANANEPASWTLNLNTSGGMQRQHLLAGGDTVTTNYSVGISGQNTRYGSLNLIFTGGEITQLTGLPALRQRGVQLEALHPLSARAAVKVYSRDIQRNIGDPLSGATERVTGIQLSYTL
ncbi:MAG: hypothetical protein JWN73_1954 [Betaproteobacteria bacterium]|nr:hypothetical protein [Betaproteobacteria bacterium]